MSRSRSRRRLSASSVSRASSACRSASSWRRRPTSAWRAPRSRRSRARSRSAAWVCSRKRSTSALVGSQGGKDVARGTDPRGRSVVGKLRQEILVGEDGIVVIPLGEQPVGLGQQCDRWHHRCGRGHRHRRRDHHCRRRCHRRGAGSRAGRGSGGGAVLHPARASATINATVGPRTPRLRTATLIARPRPAARSP